MLDKSLVFQRNFIIVFLEFELDSEIEIGDYLEFEGFGIMFDIVGREIYLLKLMIWKINLFVIILLIINYLKIMKIFEIL